MKKLYFTYNKDNGLIASYSEKKNKQSKTNNRVKMLMVSEKEHELLDENYTPYIRKGKLVLEKPQRLIDEEKNTRKKVAREILEKKAKEGTGEIKELSELILKLL